MTLRPPQNMRLASKGIAFEFLIFAIRGSYHYLGVDAVSCARDLYTM